MPLRYDQDGNHKHTNGPQRGHATAIPIAQSAAAFCSARAAFARLRDNSRFCFTQLKAKGKTGPAASSIVDNDHANLVSRHDEPGLHDSPARSSETGEAKVPKNGEYWSDAALPTSDKASSKSLPAPADQGSSSTGEYRIPTRQDPPVAHSLLLP
ncbi:hypothetical protein VTK56DRAFT_10069 [Thermocarpiscus australiensis]